MLKKTIIFSAFLLVFAVHGQNTYRIPKAVFLTTGADQGRGTVSDGIVLALQYFHQMGIHLQLENREILLQPDQLSQFDILIIPTIKGYHDQPQAYSLTYMSDVEMDNINKWVKNGGTLISDINLARNDLKGNDRVGISGKLNNKTWSLSTCFGVQLEEQNTKNAKVIDTGMQIWPHQMLNRQNKEIWQLIPTKIAKDVKVLAQWQWQNHRLPALTLHHYGKGQAFLLPSFYLLHPLSDGGLSGNEQIRDFYRFVYQTIIGKHRYQIQISPWKNGHTAVYCQTFDDGGNMEQYQRIFDFIEKNKLPTVFFVTPQIDQNIARLLKDQTYVSIQGHSFSHPDFRKIDYGQTQSELLMNREFWQTKFIGFRFPYVSNSFWGLYTLDKLHFIYDTSIAANHLEYLRGAVVPYNIPIFNNDFYTTLDLIEISQIYHSDWYFYQKVLEQKPYTQAAQQHDATRFKQYLFKYFNSVTQPNGGIMVYLGHPMYAGISDTTLQALQDLIDYLRRQNVWFASLNEVAERWLTIKKLKIDITENNRSVTVQIHSKQKVKDFSLFIDHKPKSIKNVKVYKVKPINDRFCIIFDVKIGTTTLNILF